MPKRFDFSVKKNSFAWRSVHFRYYKIKFAFFRYDGLIEIIFPDCKNSITSDT